VGERRRSGAAPTATRCRAVFRTVRPHGSYGRHRGRHRQVVHEPAMAQKVDFLTPRGAFGCGGAMFTGGRNRDPMPSGTLTPFVHTMRGQPDHRSASAVPVLWFSPCVCVSCSPAEHGVEKYVKCTVKLRSTVQLWDPSLPKTEHTAPAPKYDAGGAPRRL
jgi:hypothetical protein